MFGVRKIISRRLFIPPNLQWQPRAKYQNFVMSNTLSQLESQCEKYCPRPRIQLRKIAVLGAASDVGRIVCLFLKQQRVIRILAMYDDDPCRNVLGVANDIAHIDTSPAVEAYQGRMYLKNALKAADVVLICGGNYILPPCCCSFERELFCQNMSFVRTVTIATAKFAPHAIIAIQTPPVDANFTLVKHTLKITGSYDKRKVLGVNSINAMRANQLYCAIEGIDPATTNTPVVGGCGRCTRVPVFSILAAKACKFKLEKHAEDTTRLVREADELICRVKSNCEQGHLSIGFSTARFVTSLMKGIFDGEQTIDSAMVEQSDIKGCYGLKYCSTPVKVGKSGITTYMIPKLSAFESNLLEESKCYLDGMLMLGKCNALGEDYCIDFCTCCQLPPCCKVVEPCEKQSQHQKNK